MNRIHDLTERYQHIHFIGIGGVSMSGGEGKVILSMVGALVIGSIRNILNLLSVNSFYQNILVGVIIITVVAISMMTRARRESKTAQFAAAESGALKE